MRGYRDLLILLLSECTSSQDFLGMCVSARSLYYKGKISLDEYYYLANYIRDNIIEHQIICDRGFWWKVGVKKPRIDWIEQQLKKLKDEEDEE